MVLDLLMPKTDGFAVLKALQEHDIKNPVIVMTNLSDDTNRDKCMKMGAVGFFVKSDIGEDEIWPLVSKHL